MTVARLVDHTNPESRETPLLLLAALREIDPTIELVYFGARDWRLGAVRSGEARDFRAEKGDRMLDQLIRLPQELQNPKSIMLAYLLKQGFAQIAQYIDQGDPSGTVLLDGEPATILEDFRQRDYWFRLDQGEEVVMHGVAEAGGRSKQAAADAKMKDYLSQDGRDHYAREMRGRIQSGPGGVTGGRGKLFTPGGSTRRIITGEEVLADIAEIMAELGGGVPA